MNGVGRLEHACCWATFCTAAAFFVATWSGAIHPSSGSCLAVLIMYLLAAWAAWPVDTYADEAHDASGRARRALLLYRQASVAGGRRDEVWIGP